MLLSGLKPDVIGNDDEYIQTVFEIGDTTEAWVQVRALEQYGVETEFRQDGSWSEVEELLEKGIPVPLGILHHGGVTNPHWRRSLDLRRGFVSRQVENFSSRSVW